MRLFDVPTAIWAYGLLRAVAFAAPQWLGVGGIGLGAVVVVVLFVPLVAGRRWAWVALLVLDGLSLALVVLALVGAPAGEVPLLIPLLAVASYACLLWPSVRRHVTAAAATVGSSPPPGTPG